LEAEDIELELEKLLGGPFGGSAHVGLLREVGWGDVSSGPGVYAVVGRWKVVPGFLPVSTGGRFKGKDPTVSVETLRAKWVDRASVLYVGKSIDLATRIQALVDFGYGKPVAHWGGRYLWQLPEPERLVISWRRTERDDPASVETQVLRRFAEGFGGKLPFANLKGGKL